MGIIKKITSRMLKQYDYYGYGDDTAAEDDTAAVDTYYEEPAVEMEDDEKAHGPMVMAYMLVPVFDGISWYVTNDKWSAASNSDWTNAYNSMLAGAIYKTVVLGATMAMMDVMGPVYYYSAALSAVWELVNLYLINTAHGTASSSTSSTKIAVGLTTVSAALSVAGFMGMMNMEKDDEEVADEYYEEEPAADDAADDNDDSGNGDAYYGYYY